MSRWILAAVALGVSISATLRAHRAVENETFTLAGECPDVLHVRVVEAAPAGHEHSALVLQALKGRVSPGTRLTLSFCCDLEARRGEEFVLMTDASRGRLRFCGQEGGWPALRRCREGAVPWDGGDGRELPLWLWRLFLPSRTDPPAAAAGGLAKDSLNKTPSSEKIPPVS